MSDFSNILTEMEQDRLAKFAEDKVLFDAVKKFILSVVYKEGVIQKGVEHNPAINSALHMGWQAIRTDAAGVPRSDEELGQNIRALASAVSLVETGFKQMEDIQEQVKVGKEKKQDKKHNEAE